MTFREKVLQMRPAARRDHEPGGMVGCPASYGLEEFWKTKCDSQKSCEDCWNREMPVDYNFKEE